MTQTGHGAGTFDRTSGCDLELILSEPRGSARMTISAAPTTPLDLFATWLVEKGLSDNTVEQRTRLAGRLLAEHQTLALDRGQVVAWLKPYKGWTRITYQNDMASIFAWLVETGQADQNHPAALPRPPKPRPRPQPFDNDTVDELLSDADGDLRTWLMFGLFAGLRRFEIAKFRGQEIGQRSIMLVGKGEQAEMIPTHPALWELAQEYPARGFWFPADTPSGHIDTGAINRAVARLYKRHGITGNIHRTRATFGTRLLRGGADIKVVQELLRHRSLTSTEAYIAAARDELGQAIDLLPAPPPSPSSPSSPAAVAA